MDFTYGHALHVKAENNRWNKLEPTIEMIERALFRLWLRDQITAKSTLLMPLREGVELALD